MQSTRSSPTTSTPGSVPRSPEPAPVGRAAVITHGKPQTIGPALERLEKVAREAGVELLLPDEEVEKHGVGEPEDDLSDADIAVVLGGDGTMLRALHRFLGTEIPVVGVNFGRVGFLASVPPNELESGLARVFSDDYRVVNLTTLEVEAAGIHGAAINDVVVLSAIKGRMVELAWALGGEDMGVQGCDGMICASPAGSTADNLSNGGPVYARGLHATGLTVFGPPRMHSAPDVVPPGDRTVVA